MIACCDISDLGLYDRRLGRWSTNALAMESGIVICQVPSPTSIYWRFFKLGVTFVLMNFHVLGKRVAVVSSPKLIICIIHIVSTLYIEY